MSQVVVDASVALAWFRTEEASTDADALTESHRDGSLQIVVPPIFPLELLNISARRWHWVDAELRALVQALEELELGRGEPALELTRYWTAAGLTAYDASYVALAEELGCELVTADDAVLALAPGVARPL